MLPPRDPETHALSAHDMLLVAVSLGPGHGESEDAGPRPARWEGLGDPRVYEEVALDLRSSTLEVTEDLTSSTLAVTWSTAWESLSWSSIFAVMP